MQGKNHIIVAAATLPGIHSLGNFLTWSLDRVLPYSITGYLWNAYALFDPGYFVRSFFEVCLWVFPCVLFYFAGTLFPDCDDEKSMLGRLIHIPVKHRTWLHAVWIPVGLFVLGGVTGIVIVNYFALGWLVHLFYDSLSAMGCCLFYPFPGYIEYPSGAKVKKGHRIKLYRNGQASETAVTVLFTLFWIGMCIFSHWAVMESSMFNILP